MERIISLGAGYLFGLFQTGYIVGKLRHIDIRSKGSGNAGSTNAVRVMGWGAGIMTFAGDVIKCVAAILLVRHFFKDSDILPLLSMYAGLGAALGHDFPVYMHFKGGKGIAVLAGIILMTDFRLIPIPLTAFLIAVILTKFVSLGSLLASAMFFLEVVLAGQWGQFHMASLAAYELYAVLFVITALAWCRHKKNIKRLLEGKESEFSAGKKNQEGN